MIVGSLVYYAAGATGILETIGVPFEIPGLEGIGPQPAYPRSEAFREFLGETLNYLPVAVPFSILVITGAINVTEAARLAGDDFNPREILITDAVATLIAGVCGGVAQSAPYFGHSAYKRMGARCAYTLATALAVGFGGMFGLIGYLVDLVPAAVVKPILILIGFDIVRLAFQMTPRRHIMGVILAMTPTVINYCYINLKTLYIHVQDGSRNLIAEVKSMGGIESGAAEKLILQIENIVPAPWLDEYLRFGALGQGFIITAVIWGATAAFVIDRQIARASVAMFIASVFSLFGVIHSVFPNSRLYLPWNLEVVAGNSLFERSLTIPYEYSAAYLLAGITLLGMYFLGPARRGRGPAQDLE